LALLILQHPPCIMNTVKLLSTAAVGGFFKYTEEDLLGTTTRARVDGWNRYFYSPESNICYHVIIHYYCSTTWCVWNDQKTLLQTHVSDHEWHECEAPPMRAPLNMP